MKLITMRSLDIPAESTCSGIFSRRWSSTWSRWGRAKMVAVFDVGNTGILLGGSWFYMAVIWFYMVLYGFIWFYGDFVWCWFDFFFCVGSVIFWRIWWWIWWLSAGVTHGGCGDHLECSGDGRQHGCGFREHRLGCHGSGSLAEKNPGDFWGILW